MSKKIVTLCSDLVSIKSVSGHEEEIIIFLKEYFINNGFEVIIDKYGSCIAHISGSRPGKRILFDGHIDTVSYDEARWKFNPLGEVVNDRIYGVGTSDMKGAIASFSLAVVDFVNECNGDFAGDIYVAFVVHEECFEGVASKCVCDYVNPDVVILGEASECNLKIAQRGRAEIKLEISGRRTHSSSPEKGINAIYKMCDVIQNIKKINTISHPVLGDGIMELIDIKSYPYPSTSVVPDYCVATYDRRLLVGETKESVMESINNVINTMMESDKELSVKASYVVGSEVCYNGTLIISERFFPAWIIDESKIIDIQSDLNKKGFNSLITKYNFCTNGSYYAGEAGIFTFGLGPSSENLSHIVDEYVLISELERAYDCYLIILENLTR